MSAMPATENMKQHLVNTNALDGLMVDIATILDRGFIIEEDGTPIIKDGVMFLEVKQIIDDFYNAIINWQWYLLFQEEMQSTVDWALNFKATIAEEEMRILTEA
jgi:hypothetical protein